MGNPKGFMTINRDMPKRRPVDVRIKDWKEDRKSTRLNSSH